MGTAKSELKSKRAAAPRKEPRERTKTKGSASKPGARSGSVAGTYVYDPKLDRIVKVSDRIPGVAAKAGRDSSDGGFEGAGGGGGEGGCGKGPCGGGSFSQPEGGFD